MFPIVNPPTEYAGEDDGQSVSDRARAHLERIHRGEDFYREPAWPSPEMLMLLHHLMAHPPATPTPSDLFLPSHKGANVDAMHHYADELESDHDYDGQAEGYITGRSGPSFKDGGYQGSPVPFTGYSYGLPQPGLPAGTPPAQPGMTLPNAPGGTNPYPDVPNMGPAAAEGFYNYLNQSAQGTGGAAGLKNIMDERARRMIDSSMAAGGLGLSGARATADQAYQNESDARYQTMVGQMYPQAFAMGVWPQQYGLELLRANPGSRTPGYGNSQAMNLAALLQQLLGGKGGSQNKPGVSAGGGPGGQPGQGQPGQGASNIPFDPLGSQPGSTYADLISQGYPPELAQLFATSSFTDPFFGAMPDPNAGGTDPFGGVDPFAGGIFDFGAGYDTGGGGGTDYGSQNFNDQGI